MQWHKENKSFQKNKSNIQFALKEMLEEKSEKQRRKIEQINSRQKSQNLIFQGSGDELGFYGQIFKMEVHRGFQRNQFRKTLFDQIGDLKALVKHYQKIAKNKKLASQKDVLKENIFQLLSQIKGEFSTIEYDLEQDYSIYLGQVNQLKDNFKREQSGQQGQFSALPGPILIQFLEDQISQDNIDESSNLEILNTFGASALGEEQCNKIKSYYQRAFKSLCQIYILQIDSNIIHQNTLPPIFNHQKELRRFQIVYDSYVRGGGKTRQQYFQRLQLEFPQLNRDQLEQIDESVEKQRWSESKIKALANDYQRELKQLKDKAILAIEKQISQTITKTQKELLALKQDAVRNRCQAELQEKKIQFQSKQQVLRQIEQEKRMKDEQINEKKIAKYKEHTEKVKKIAKEYLQDKKNKIVQQKENKLLQQAEQRKQTNLQIEKNKQKVGIRQKQQTDMLEQRVIKIKSKNEASKVRQQRINEAIEKYSIRPKIEIDSDRVKKVTASQVAKKKSQQDLDEGASIFKDYGYNMDQMMKDVRMKISTALYEAGLSGTAYANSLVKGINV